MPKNESHSLKHIQRKISATQIILIVSLSIILAVVGALINIRFERDKIDKNLQNISETIATSPSFMENDILWHYRFPHDGWEYDYLVSLEGKVLRSHREKDDDHHHSKATQPTRSNESKSDRISAEKALSIALNHAGVTDARDRDVEWDDGRWEVSFESGRTEYEYHISASGSILRWEKEQDD